MSQQMPMESTSIVMICRRCGLLRQNLKPKLDLTKVHMHLKLSITQ